MIQSILVNFSYHWKTLVDLKGSLINSNYKIVVVVTSLLITLSLTLSIMNYNISLTSTQKQLKTQSLPLSLDNIYTDIQKHIVEPYLVSSMMASDTFVKDWLVHEENNTEKITKYLDTIKNKYKMLTTFLVSEKTKKYYTNNGLIETLDKSNEENKWYFRFKEIEGEHEINLDYNSHIDNSLIMFINYKIFNNDYNILGATGVGLKISYINDMLKMFKQKYKLNVYFFNAKGEVLLSESENIVPRNIDDIDGLKEHRRDIFSKETVVLEYEKFNNEYILTTKYISELDLYLVVEAKLNDFTGSVKQTFYFNLIVSLLITVFVAYIILVTVRKYHKQLEYLADNDTLTNLSNRRSFSKQFNYFLKMKNRNNKPISLLFMDIDNFKVINDTLGHDVGDRVLERFAKILDSNIREIDLVARWGGEEFIIAYIDTDIEKSHKIADKLCELIESDLELKELVDGVVTASFGLVAVDENDTLESIVSRADRAMYKAKDSGKNRVVKV